MRIRFSGYGGQGIGLMGLIFGHAATLAGKNALQTQSYGSEARGGTSKSDVEISDDPINEFELDKLDVLVAMSQQALTKYIDDLKKDGFLICDKDLVKLPVDMPNCNTIPATNIAAIEFKRKMVANMVMIGYVAKVLSLFPSDYLFESLKEHVDTKFFDLDYNAIEAGLNYNL